MPKAPVAGSRTSRAAHPHIDDPSDSDNSCGHSIPSPFSSRASSLRRIPVCAPQAPAALLPPTKITIQDYQAPVSSVQVTTPRSARAEDEESEARALRRRVVELQGTFFDQLQACTEQKEKAICNLSARLEEAIADAKDKQRTILAQQAAIEDLEHTLALQAARLTINAQGRRKQAAEFCEAVEEMHDLRLHTRSLEDTITEREKEIDKLHARNRELEDLAEERNQQIERLTNYVRLTFQINESHAFAKALECDETDLPAGMPENPFPMINDVPRAAARLRTRRGKFITSQGRAATTRKRGGRSNSSVSLD
eukprot:EG_transcript_9606